jgi:hypothetical protein
MPPAKPTAKEEADFMSNLLANVDATDWDDYILSPVKVKSPAKAVSKPRVEPPTTCQATNKSLPQIFATPCKNKKRKAQEPFVSTVAEDGDFKMSDAALEDFWDYELSPEKPKPLKKCTIETEATPVRVDTSLLFKALLNT